MSPSAASSPLRPNHTRCTPISICCAAHAVNCRCPWLRSAELAPRMARPWCARAQTCWQSSARFFPHRTSPPPPGPLHPVSAPPRRSIDERRARPFRTRPTPHTGRREFAGPRLQGGGWRPGVHRQRRRTLHVRSGRQALHRLRRLLGPDDPGACPSGGDRGGGRGNPQGSVVRRADRTGNAHGRPRVRTDAVHRNGPHGLLRHRGDHVGNPARARIHRARQDRQVRRLLPRTLGLTAGQGRVRRTDPRRAIVARRPGIVGRTHHHPELTTTSTRSATPSPPRATRSPASSSNRSPAT